MKLTDQLFDNLLYSAMKKDVIFCEKTAQKKKISDMISNDGRANKKKIIIFPL